MYSFLEMISCESWTAPVLRLFVWCCVCSFGVVLVRLVLCSFGVVVAFLSFSIQLCLFGVFVRFFFVPIYSQMCCAHFCDDQAHSSKHVASNHDQVLYIVAILYSRLEFYKRYVRSVHFFSLSLSLSLLSSTSSHSTAAWARVIWLKWHSSVS